MASVNSDEPRRGEVTVNGLRLRYLDWGGDGPPIIVLHATGLLGRIYAPIAHALSTIGHVYSYDQRGHGDSERPAADDFEWTFTVSDLEGFITAMGFSEVRGFGHSAGATAIGVLARRRPELIPRAVLAEPVIFDAAIPERPEFDLHDRTIKRKRVFDNVAAMYENFADKPPFATWDRQCLRDYCEFGTRPADGRRALKCAPEVEAAFYASARRFDGFGEIVKYRARLLILFGAHSDSPGRLVAERLASPNREVRTLADSGHFLPLEHPQEVARIALEFLR